MNAPVLSAGVIAQYARELATGASKTPVVALYAQPSWDGVTALDIDGHTVLVRGCESSLAVREALLERPDDGFLIVLTDQESAELGESITSRFRYQRVERVDPWGTVAQMFAAGAVRADLRRLGPEMATALATNRPHGGYPPAPAGVVTAEHAANALLAAVLGTSATPTVVELLGASRQPTARDRWQALPETVRDALHGWSRDGVGVAAPAVLDVIGSGTYLDAVTVGLAADVLWQAPVGTDALRAQGRLEAYTGGRTMDDTSARGLAEAAKAYLRSLPAEDASRSDLALRAEALLGDLQWAVGAAHSDVLPSGFTARERALADAINGALAGQPLADLERSLIHLQNHDAAASHATTLASAQMAVRLVRWLATPPPAITDLAGALQLHIDDEGWVDRALADVWAGTTDPDVSTAYQGLAERVRLRRTDSDQRFAALLAGAVATDRVGEAGMLVEEVLARLVAPLTAHTRVMLLVVDGMSAAVAAELVDDAVRRGWVEMVAGVRRTPVIAALPTLTRYSRTSLFAGELRDGGQADEKRSLAAAFPGALLFHKDDLRAAAGHVLPIGVREAAQSDAPVVGAVLNSVDDALAKADPDGTDWTIAAVQHLGSLLDLAWVTGRTVVLTSDHGHVVERGSHRVEYAGAEARFRPAVGQPGAGEVLLDGPRLFGGPVIAAAVEDLRYANKAAGYHGGVTPAEVTIPFVVLTREPAALAAAGWQAAPPQAPEWWSAPLPPGRSTGLSQPPVAAPPPPRRARVSAEPVGMDALFDTSSVETGAGMPGGAEVPGAAADDAAAAAIGVAQEVMDSPTYRTRVQGRNARGLPDDAVMRAALACLLERGGRAHKDVLARAAGLPVTRMPGLLAALTRALNLDGYQAISVDPDGVTVVLDEPLLREQFGVADVADGNRGTTGPGGR